MGTVLRRKGSKFWWIQYCDQGKVFRESSRSTSQEVAKRLLRKRLGEVASGQFRGLQAERAWFSALTDLVLDDYRRRKRKSIRDVEIRLKNHVLPFFGDLRAVEIGGTLINRYTDLRLAAGAAPASINRELAIIRRAFRLGYQADPQLVVKLPHVKALPESNVRTGIFEKSDFEKIRHHLPDQMKPIATVAYETAMRIEEIRNLLWDFVNLEMGLIQLPAGYSKNGEARDIPMFREVADLLRKLKAARDRDYSRCPFVFHSGGVQIGKSAFRSAWNNARVLAGMPKALVHDFRRTTIRNMDRAGVPQTVAMKITGQKTASIWRRYRISDHQDLKDAARLMDAYSKGTDTESDPVDPER